MNAGSLVTAAPGKLCDFGDFTEVVEKKTGFSEMNTDKRVRS